MYHKWAIENSPLQVYASALLFSPARSLIRGLFKEEELKMITIKPVMGDKWSACLQTLEGHGGTVRSVAFSHDSTRLASGSGDETVKIWDTGNGDCLQTLKGHGGTVGSVAFSHDSTRLASGSGDKTVKIWDTGSGACVQTLDVGKGLFNISFNSTGTYLRTDIGTIAIDTSSAIITRSSIIDSQKPRYQGVALSSDGIWITYNAENLVWLPSEYRPSNSAVLGTTIGFSVASGKVCICKYNEIGNSQDH
jgi:WD40 repeat protein